MENKRFAIVVEDTGRGYFERMMGSFYHSNKNTKQTYRFFNINRDIVLINFLPHHFNYVLYIHDDIIFCNNFLDSVQEWIEQNLNEENKIVSFYLPSTIWHHDILIKDKYTFKPDLFYGTQAILINIEDDKKLKNFMFKVNNNVYKGLEEIPIVVFEQITSVIRTNRASDRIYLRFWIYEWIKSLEGMNSIVSTIPSFVQHIGEISTFKTHPFHRCTNFLGENWSYI